MDTKIHSFIQNNQKIVLTLILSLQDNKHHSTKDKYHSLTTLLQADHHEHFPFRELLLSNSQKPNTTTNKPNHPFLTLLITTYQDVFPQAFHQIEISNTNKPNSQSYATKQACL